LLFRKKNLMRSYHI